MAQNDDQTSEDEDQLGVGGCLDPSQGCPQGYPDEKSTIEKQQVAHKKEEEIFCVVL